MCWCSSCSLESRSRRTFSKLKMKMAKWALQFGLQFSGVLVARIREHTVACTRCTRPGPAFICSVPYLHTARRLSDSLVLGNISSTAVFFFLWFSPAPSLLQRTCTYRELFNIDPGEGVILRIYFGVIPKIHMYSSTAVSYICSRFIHR